MATGAIRKSETVRSNHNHHRRLELTEAKHLKRVTLFIIAVALVFSVGGASFANFMTHRHAQAQPAIHAPVKK
jgi:hypothetical protein